ncbi:MAG: TlpA family protein disulfide reductase [Haliea sp.]|nr:MAG: TlpA family protein disulfide reductase [Haliea sp.]
MQDEHGRARRLWLLRAAAVAAAAGLPVRGHAETQRWPARMAAPFWSATDLEGRSWDTQALRGRAVLLNFWASWCEPCRSEMPTLQQLADFHGTQRLAVLAINFKEAHASAARFARNTALSLPVLLDPQGAVARVWAVKVFPTTVLIDHKGLPRWRVRGEMDWTGREAQALVDGLLA